MRRFQVLVILLAVLLTGCTVEEWPANSPSPTAIAGRPIAQEDVSDPAEQAPVVSATVAPVPTLELEMTNALEEEQALLVELYRRVNPAVVSIQVVGRSRETEEDQETQDDVPFAEGSGFVFDDQGHVVTNNHVVAGATGYQVRFFDGEIVEAELVGRDPHSDLAVLKVVELPPGTAPLQLADSSKIEVGQTAIAIGNPFGERNTLTVGVISGLGRSLVGPRSGNGSFPIPNIIQTDAAINPGNSGGPLLNIYGEVIGVNTAIRTDTGAFQGVGYAVPSNAVARVAPALIRDGRYQHPWIGIRMYNVDPLLARHFKLDTKQGVLVTEVQSGSPAAQAGLRAGKRQGNYGGLELAYDGDIITAIDGQVVRSSDDLVSYLELETSVGDTVILTVVRDGEEQQLDLTLGSRPGD